MKMKLCKFVIAAGVLASGAVTAAPPFAVGAAPAGDAAAVASRIIKYNFPTCSRVAGAARQKDGSIRASCDGTSYLVFTLFNKKEGKLSELALNCNAAKKMGVEC
jgi:hypothetical protein